MAPQDSENCGRDFAKRKQTDADFAANSLLRMVIIDIASNVLLSRVTRHPAGMHCPSWDDAFVSSYNILFVCPAIKCNPGYVVHTCASVTKQYNLVPAKVMSGGWEGNRRSGVALATCHRH